MNWDQLRHKIDAGETRDKVAWSDPAIAPLGTDEEAGGASTSPEDIAASALQQVAPDRDAPTLSRAVILLGAAAALAIMLVLLLVWASSTGA